MISSPKSKLQLDSRTSDLWSKMLVERPPSLHMDLHGEPAGLNIRNHPQPKPFSVRCSSMGGGTIMSYGVPWT